MIRNRFAEHGCPADTQQRRRQNRKVILQQSNFPLGLLTIAFSEGILIVSSSALFPSLQSVGCFGAADLLFWRRMDV